MSNQNNSCIVTVGPITVEKSGQSEQAQVYPLDFHLPKAISLTIRIQASATAETVSTSAVTISEHVPQADGSSNTTHGDGDGDDIFNLDISNPFWKTFQVPPPPPPPQSILLPPHLPSWISTGDVADTSTKLNEIHKLREQVTLTRLSLRLNKLENERKLDTLNDLIKETQQLRMQIANHRQFGARGLIPRIRPGPRGPRQSSITSPIRRVIPSHSLLISPPLRYRRLTPIRNSSVTYRPPPTPCSSKDYCEGSTMPMRPLQESDAMKLCFACYARRAEFGQF